MTTEAQEIGGNIAEHIRNVHSIEKGARPIVKAYMGADQGAQLIDNIAEALAETFRYQGWSNRETWCVGLWLGNEKVYYDTARFIALGAGTIHQKADKLSSYVEDLLAHASDRLAGGNGHGDRMAIDLATAATCRVNWRELVNHFAAD